MHGTYVTVDGRPALRFERRLPHPVEAVWRAVTEPAGLASWFPAEVTVDLRVGGAMSFAFPEAEQPATAGRITELDPPHRFAFDWGDDHLRFELEPEDDGAACRLVFVHLLDERYAAARNAAGWHLCLDGLARVLAGAPAAAPSSGPTDAWRERYEDYVGRGFPAGAPIPSA